MAARKGTRRGLTIPWRQSDRSASQVEAAGTAARPFTSLGMPIDYLKALEASRPATYAKIRRFEQLWSRDRVTREDFHAFVRLMHHVGSKAEAEHFLRSNLLVSADNGESWFLDDAGLDLYTELFGTAKRDEFAAAIAAFRLQFSAPLAKGGGGGFMVGYETKPRSVCLDKYLMRNEPCYVRFEYESKDYIEATLESLKPESEQLLFLRWVKGVWEIIGTSYCTVIREDEERRTKRCT
jgi:hypothetical protein